MKEETGVRISEFLDGELSRDELDTLLKEMQQSDAQEQLKRFSRIGHALRGENILSVDVSEAVANAIADMPMDTSTTASKLTLAAEASRSTGFGRWFKPALGAAFASVVAAFTIMLNTGVNQVADQNTVPAVAQQQASPQQKVLELTQFARQSAEPMDTEVREELNTYLVNHSQSASGGNYQGMVPYVRSVSYEPGQNPTNKTQKK